MLFSKRNLPTGAALAAALAAGYGLATFGPAPAPADAHGEEARGEEGHADEKGGEEGFIALAADQAAAAGVAVVTVGRGGGPNRWRRRFRLGGAGPLGAGPIGH